MRTTQVNGSTGLVGKTGESTPKIMQLDFLFWLAINGPPIDLGTMIMVLSLPAQAGGLIETDIHEVGPLIPLGEKV